MNSEAAEKLKNVTIEENDVLLNITGDSVARTCVVPKEILPARVNQHVSIIRPVDDLLNYKYLVYYLASPYMQAYMLNLAVGKGASRNALTKSMIENFQIPLPPLETQIRIADILSAYDDLIENNQKQIKLLEEAAMRLYKEWFVNLRFPGYENTKIVDGVPEGWRLGRVSELAEFKRGKTITKKNAKDGNVPVVAGGLEPAYFHNVANTVAPVITISASGANAGYTRLYNTDIWASDCSYIDASYGDKLYFIYTFLKNNKEVIDNLQRGAAQPHVYAKDINALSTYIPESTIMEPFCNLVAPLFKKIAVQERLISELKQARDKLLPKLMSGEIEV
jgi:type I restriction enzyme S subunit